VVLNPFFFFPQRKDQKKAPEVRLELTTYRLTAGRATDCAIQDLVCTDNVAEWLRPAKLMGFARVGSNPTVVDFFFGKNKN
jgi:hypothetical protein